jgi:hypothetical protein
MRYGGALMMQKNEGDPILCTQILLARGHNIVDGVGESSTLADQVYVDVVPEVLGEKVNVLVSNGGTISSVPAPNGYGHCKDPTPITETRARRCTRKNKEGYIFESLPDCTRRRKVSSVPKDMPPIVLIKITEVKHIGVEECLINTEGLTEEHLHQDR